MNSYEVETYEDFLQAITELYDQNKLDFNNYKLLKNEIKKLESNHNQDIKNFRKYLNVLENKIKNSGNGGNGGGVTESQVQNIVSNYVTTHKSELTGARGEKGEKGDKGDKGDKGEQGIQGTQGIQGNKGSDGLTTQIKVNGTTYTQSNGLITLPDYPTSSPYNIWVGTQTEYDGLSTKDNNTLYFIKEG